MADKELTERRVYVLPNEQIERIRAYQARNGIASEVEAVRRLLDTALQLRDTVPDLLNKLKSRFAEEKDLRVLARDILAGHALVRSVHFEDNAISFSFNGEDRGRIDSDGNVYVGGNGGYDNWERYVAPQRRKSGSPSWDAPKGGDLDDEIPF